MRNRTKKEEKDIEAFIGLLLVLSAAGGWYVTKSLMGMGIAVGASIVVMAFIQQWRAVRFKNRMKESGIEEVDQMTGRQFEEYLGALFSSKGYNIKYTPASGDYGADVILTKGQDVIVVQAKRYKSRVGVKAVQEVIPAIKMYKATEAWVITNSTYTKQALTLARHNQVRMIDREDLIRISLEVKRA